MRATPWTDAELERMCSPEEDYDDITPLGVRSKLTYLAQEVLYLRRHMAYAARTVEAQTLDLSSLAKGRRKILTECVAKLRRLARGESEYPADKREYNVLIGKRDW